MILYGAGHASYLNHSIVKQFTYIEQEMFVINLLKKIQIGAKATEEELESKLLVAYPFLQDHGSRIRSEVEETQQKDVEYLRQNTGRCPIPAQEVGGAGSTTRHLPV